MKSRAGALSRRLWQATSLLAVATPTQAWAADEQPKTDEAVDEPIIIVEAQRRSQSIIDVPISITAVDGDQLTQRGISDVSSLSQAAVGVSITSPASESRGGQVRIRGIGTSGSNPGLEGAVGIFIDGIYIDRPGAALGDLLDIERVEVLRGPQGTLFGKNTSAGAISIATKKPAFHFGVEAIGGVGNYGAIRSSVSLTGPLVDDKVAVRVAGLINTRNGFVTDIRAGVHGNDRNRWQLRGQLLTELSSDISFRLIADVAHKDEACCVAVQSTNGPVAAITTALGGTILPGGGVEGLTGATNLNRTFLDKSTNWGVSGELNWNIGGIKLTAILSTRKFTSRTTGDTDYSNIDLLYRPDGFGGSRYTSGEVRLNGSFGILDWLVGGYAFDESIREGDATLYGADFGRYISALSGLSCVTIIPAGPNSGLVPLALPVGVPCSGPNPATGGTLRQPLATFFAAGSGLTSTAFNQSGKGWSLFTHNILKLTDQLSVTAGLRYSHESKDGTGVITANTTCPAISPVVPAANRASLTRLFALCQAPNFDESYRDGRFSGTANISYKVLPNVLVYGSYSRGYKAGGINLATNAGLFASQTFLPETSDSYEWGIKGALRGGKLSFSLTGYVSEISDLQVNSFTGTQFVLTNAASASTRGFEFEVRVKPLSALTLSGSVAYNKARYGSDTVQNDPTKPQLAGRQLNSAPDWTLQGAVDYDADLGNDYALNLNASVASYSSHFTGADLNAAKFQEGYALVNSRIGLSNSRMGLSVSLWATNLFDKRYKAVTIDAPFQSGSFVAFTGAPREWGVELRKTF